MLGALEDQNSTTLLIPSCASMSSKPRFTSSSLILCGDERVDIDLAGQPEVDELRNLVAAFDAAEGRARDAPFR